MRKIGKTRPPTLERPAASKDMATPVIAVRDSPPRRIAGATISGWSSSLDIDFDKLLSRRPIGVSIVSGAAPDAAGVLDAPDAAGVLNTQNAAGVPNTQNAAGIRNAPETPVRDRLTAAEPAHMPRTACLPPETVSLSDGTHITFTTTDRFESISTV